VTRRFWFWFRFGLDRLTHARERQLPEPLQSAPARHQAAARDLLALGNVIDRAGFVPERDQLGLAELGT
jgi:hypothetical protein